MTLEQMVATKYSLEYTIKKWKELGLRVDGNFTAALKEIKKMIKEKMENR